jgi:hypothetical protein
MINPDHVCTVDGECVTSPYVLGVDISDGDVSASINSFLVQKVVCNLLDDNVACTADNPQTLTLDHTTGTRSEQ